MTAARARRAPPASPSPVPAPGAAASPPSAPPLADEAKTPTAPGPVLVFPRPFSDPGRLGIPLQWAEATALARLERRVGREAYQGWCRDSGDTSQFVVIVDGRRFYGDSLLEAVSRVWRSLT